VTEGVDPRFDIGDTAERLHRARQQIKSALGTALSASTGPDNEALGDPDRALLTTAALLRQVAAQLDSILRSVEDDATPELLDLALAVPSCADVTRVAVAMLTWQAQDASSLRRADVGHAAARLAFLASEALRAEAVVPLAPVGASVPDVPSSLLWRIAELTARLRSSGRIGPTAAPYDAGVATRDAADLVVTTYRRWAPRLRGHAAEAVARAAVTTAYATTYAGLSTLILGDDDGGGCGASVCPHPPELWDEAAAEIPRDPVPMFEVTALSVGACSRR